MKHNLVRTKKQMRKLLNWFEIFKRTEGKYRAFSVDTETYVPDELKRGFKKEGLVLDKARIYMISLSRGDSSWVIPTSAYSPEYLDTDYVIRNIKPYMEDKTIIKVMHHANYDVNMFNNHGCKVRNVYCTMLAGACWDETIPLSLKERCVLIGIRMKKTKTVNMSDVNEFAAYAGTDAIATWGLYEGYEFGRKVEVRGDPRNMLLKGVRRKFFELEMKLLPRVIRMERHGFQFDPKLLAKIDKQIKEKIQKTESYLYTKNGEPFNINSKKQLAVLLYDKLGIPPFKVTKAGNRSCDKESLARIRKKHKAVPFVIEYSQLKALLKYCRKGGGLQDYCDKHDRIHTTFSQLGARTARASASNPPLQQMPSKMDKFGIRNCFKARPGKVLIVGDKDQLELRLMANFSRDRMMLRAYKKGLSIHLQTGVECGLLPKIALDPECPKDKKEEIKKSKGYYVSKNCNFGLMYEGSRFTLAKQLILEGIDTNEDECQEIIDKYWEIYSGVPEYRYALYDLTREKGFVTNICGRPYRILNIDSEVYSLRKAAERQTINTQIQGSGADVIKYNMWDIVNDEELKSYNYEMILQIHDEIIGEVDEKYAEQATARTKFLMDKPPPNPTIELTIPLTASVGHGLTWATAKH